MKRKGAQKHPTEVIQQAIAKYEGGARLSAIARDLGIRKSTVKYWLDNATKFMGEGSHENPVTARIQKRLTSEVWDIIFAALKILKGKLEQTTARDLIDVISELFDRQAQFGALAARAPMPEKVMEKSQEIRIMVQQYLQKKQPQATSEPSEKSLSAAPLEQTKSPDAAPAAQAIPGAESEGNGGT